MKSALPSTKAAPAGLASQSDEQKVDPFRARGATPPPNGVGEEFKDNGLPSMDRADDTAAMTPFAKPAVINPPSAAEVDADMPAAAAITSKPLISDARKKSDDMLLAARTCIGGRRCAYGQGKRGSAKSLGVEYGYHEDTPARVESTIRKYEEIMAQGGNRDSEGWRRSYAELLMDQANQLLKWNQFDDAERLAGDADRMNVNFGPFDAKPAALIERINTERKGAGG